MECFTKQKIKPILSNPAHPENPDSDKCSKMKRLVAE
jgi:hypothetical protein